MGDLLECRRSIAHHPPETADKKSDFGHKTSDQTEILNDKNLNNINGLHCKSSASAKNRSKDTESIENGSSGPVVMQVLDKYLIQSILSKQ